MTANSSLTADTYISPALCGAGGGSRPVITERVSGLRFLEGDPFAEPAREPGLVDLPCRHRKHRFDGVVGVGLLVVP